MSKTIMITGGFGFLGTNLVKYWRGLFGEERIVVVDLGVEGSDATEVLKLSPAVMAARIDIRDPMAVHQVINQYLPDSIIHLAAVTQVPRDVDGLRDFAETNVLGTVNLMRAWRNVFSGDLARVFLHVSTAQAPDIAPISVYEASKAASDLLALAYCDIPLRVANCVDNFGPHHNGTSLINTAIRNLLRREHLAVDGQLRDWCHVDDTCKALAAILCFGKNGERYHVGGDLPLSDIKMAHEIYEICLANGWIPHDLRFHVEHSISAYPTSPHNHSTPPTKLREMGWRPMVERFHERLTETIRWHLDQDVLQ